MSLTSYQAAPPRIFTYADGNRESKLKKVIVNAVDFADPRIGSSGRIRTYDQSVNSRPLYH